jgi:hypothetical protein
VRALGLLLLAACTPDDEIAFGMVGEVADSFGRGSTLGIWTVSRGPYTYKFGSGASSPTIFDLAFRSDPPLDAIDSFGIGVAQVGMLPGIATVPDGVIMLEDLALIGLSAETAIIFKTPGSFGNGWSDAFPDGFSCGQCVHETDAPDHFVPIDCTFVVIETSFVDQCVWY